VIGARSDAHGVAPQWRAAGVIARAGQGDRATSTMLRARMQASTLAG
jgi:hypothetical protein